MTKKVQIIVAAFVIAVLALIALPNFLPPRITAATNACVNNLRSIQSAKDKWAEAYHKGPTERPTEAELYPETNSVPANTGGTYPGDSFRKMPACPAGGTYTIGTINEEPKCSIGPPYHSLHPEN